MSIYIRRWYGLCGYTACLQKQKPAFEIGGSDNLKQESIESFAVKLSNYLGVEIGGAYASENNNGAISHMTIGSYNGNKGASMNISQAILPLNNFYNVNQNQSSLLGHFHVHPKGTTDPSPRDKITRDSWKKDFKSSIFNILINNPQERNGYERVPY